MRKRITTTFAFLGFAALALAQQPAQYSMFMMNKLNWNPAYAGMENSLVATGIHRSQWQGLEGSPVTQNISLHLPINIISSGFGLNLESDALGAQRITSATAMYNYQLPLGKRAVLSLGGSATFFQRSLDGSILRTPEGQYTDGIIVHNDNLLPLGQVSGNVLTYGAGAYLLTERIEVGIAARHLSEPTAAMGELLDMGLKRAYFFTAHTYFDLRSNLSLHPSLLVRSDLVQTQTDLAALFQYNGNITAGASFRGYDSNSIDAVAFIVGFKLSEKVSAAYAYDLTLSALAQVSNGSHEIMLSYNLNRPLGVGRLPKIIYNPRSL